MPGREALLLAATSAFARHGYDSVDLRSLAAAAKVDPGLVRVHFGGKEGLWLASIDHVASYTTQLHAEIRRLTAETRPLRQRVTDAIRLTVNFHFNHPELGLFIAQQARESGTRLAALKERLLRPALDAFMPLLDQAVREGVTHASDPFIAFSILAGAFFWPSTAPDLVQSLSASPMDRSQFQEHFLENLIAVFLSRPD